MQNRIVKPQKHDLPTEGLEWDKPLVTIECWVYNQEKYVRQCLDGFIMQETTFPFEAIVHDDASSDGSAQIIREYAAKYPHIIKSVIETENQWSKHDGSIEGVLQNATSHSSVYIAECEGDDYWISPDKLETQVNFLEANPDYTMCFHSGMEHWQDSDKSDKVFCCIEDRDYTGPDFLDEWIVLFATQVFRKSLYTSDVWKKRIESKKFCYGDTPLSCSCAEHGKVRGMSMVSSVYRRNEGGVTFRTAGDISHIMKRVRFIQEFPVVFGDKYKVAAQKHVCITGVDGFIHGLNLGHFPIRLLTTAITYAPIQTIKYFPYQFLRFLYGRILKLKKKTQSPSTNHKS